MKRGARHWYGAVLACLAVTCSGSPAEAVKWSKTCPEEAEDFVSAGGGVYVSSLFAHVGHELTWVIKDSKLQSKGGGFSVEPDGNRVEITFMPPHGEPIPLPPFTVAGISPARLTFRIPDTSETMGRMLVGPAIIYVWRGDTLLIRSKRPVIIPPPNDVHALMSVGGEAAVLGAIDWAGNMWVPLTFGGFGSTAPPECPAEMTPIVSLAVDFSLEKGPGQLIPHTSLTKLKQTQLFLGDFVLNGTNLYGMRIPQRIDVRRLRGAGYVLCAVNDTLDLVLRMPLHANAERKRSEIVEATRDGSPFTLRFRNIAGDPGVAERLEGLESDSLSSPCFALP